MDEQAAPLEAARRAFQLGRLHEARALLVGEDGDAASLLLGRIARRLAAPSGGPVTLVWQYDNAEKWQADWIRLVLHGAYTEEIADYNRHIAFRPRMFVVENGLTAERAGYFREAFRRGCEVVLIHLGDEWFTDDTSAYQWCRAVFRGFWSPLLHQDRDVQYLALGYKAGFARDAAPRPAAERAHLWSFAGDANKSRRPAMLEALRPLGPARLHLTSGWDTPDALDVAAYRALMDDSVIVPCPGGWSNLDCFRVWEALEAGCIPIVERLEGFDYFREALGPHPIPTVADWTEAAACIAAWQGESRLETLRAACHAWWLAHKTELARRLARAIGG